jgi:hypothetical protein
MNAILRNNTAIGVRNNTAIGVRVSVMMCDLVDGIRVRSSEFKCVSVQLGKLLLTLGLRRVVSPVRFIGVRELSSFQRIWCADLGEQRQVAEYGPSSPCYEGFEKC